ncbi:MAG: ABC transporter ATP-binding protein [Ruminococcaceae bacterium]|nr:ABC transporter ATP-binding protein [Oscillospiraceae bacterium]
MSEPVLTCRNLCKSYKTGVPVLHNLNMNLSGGKIVGLLGPNGCGKSTLIKLVSGLLTPDSGEIFICGEPQSEATNAYVSYLPERTYLSSRMKVSELLDYFSEFYDDFDKNCALRMLHDLNIDATATMSTLSKGTKEKVQLVVVMSRRAKLYLLDEPIAGVDPAARDYILQTIIGNYNPEAAVIITTHLIYDVEPVLDEFAFLGFGGQVLLSGVADEIREEHGKSLDELFREVFRCSRNY